MSGSGQESTHRKIEQVARESYGRLVAYLSSHTRDVASAEDALSDALVAALTTWPRQKKGEPRMRSRSPVAGYSGSTNPMLRCAQLRSCSGTSRAPSLSPIGGRRVNGLL